MSERESSVNADNKRWGSLHSPQPTRASNRRSVAPVFVAIVVTAFYSASPLAADKYDRKKICGDSNLIECDLLIEKAVSESIPGAIYRTGRVIKIRARNGKTIEREGTSKEAEGEGSRDIWACDYLATYGYLRLCYRLWERAQTEYISLETGDSVLIKGFPRYSPSGQQVLFIDHQVNSVLGIEIWRFERNRITREFQYSPSADFFAETGRWENENEISLVSQFSVNVIRHQIVRRKEEWSIQGP